MLTYENIKEHLNTKFIGRNIKYYDSTDSTNREAKAIALEEVEGTLVIAEEQVDGKGRLGREWISPRGKGVYMSIILKPDLDPMMMSKITLLGAASVFKALENMKIDSKIKWPNDIVIDGKKVGGILTEMDCTLNKVNYIIMGIGINVNLKEDEIPENLKNKATSIKIKEKRDIDRKLLVGHILNEFEKLYIPFKLHANGEKAIEICREKSALIGKKIKLIKGKETKYGKALDINEEGELLVEFENGEKENIFSGEISIRGEDGYIGKL